MNFLNNIGIQVKRSWGSQDLPLPKYATTGSAGLDLLAAVDDYYFLAPKERRLVPTGIYMAIPDGYEGQVRPRSGLAITKGITILNSPGTIDSDYRGEIGVIMMNLGDVPIEIKRGMKIAQLVISKTERVVIAEVSELMTTARGTGGFGHTGE